MICRFVNSFGYVQLFPFLLKLVPSESQKLGIILAKLRNSSVGSFGDVTSCCDITSCFSCSGLTMDCGHWLREISFTTRYAPHIFTHSHPHTLTTSPPHPFTLSATRSTTLLTGEEPSGSTSTTWLSELFITMATLWGPSSHRPRNCTKN